MRAACFAHFLIFIFFLASCVDKSTQTPIFVPLSVEESGIDFTNSLIYTEELNPYTFKNFYNGGGVAIGDINNDDLPDIFFGGNMVSNKLYLNKGDLKFEDITESSRVGSMDVWSTGVSMVDINADGFLDIYVCKSGPPGGEKRHNELFINNGDLTFSEKAKDYGLDNIGLSVHAAFVDYDKDGDLDCYLLNNSIKSIGSFGMARDQRMIPDSLGANKFYRNDDGFFNDITLESGIYSSEIGFGLGAMVGDVNQDNWPDIYISNDFYEKDYLYINQKDGTFKDQLENYVTEISMGSMGADLADINNDGNPEYFVTEMLPERRDRQVTKAFFDDWPGFRNAQDLGYFSQFGRNVLQLNNGDGTFSEIGRFAGVEATDWSWAALIFDMDNDGLKDIFVANGIYKDLLDLDYLNFMSNKDMVRSRIQANRDAIKSMIDMMPSEAVPNYFFNNNGNLTFTNKAIDWDLNAPSFSNGSAYGDLDNDGDLDLVVNNLNMPSLIYENRTRQILPEHNYLSIELRGSNLNTIAIGAKVLLYHQDQIFYQEQNPIRGFESCVDKRLLFGLGEVEILDSVKVIWPLGSETTLYNVGVNQLIELDQENSTSGKEVQRDRKSTIFRPHTDSNLKFQHKENDYSDFDKDRLLFHMNSTEGPCICSDDVNNDGKGDVFIGGAAGQSGILFLQTDEAEFENHFTSFELDSLSEDVDCIFFDADNDGNKDLYVASGGSDFGSLSLNLRDRLYMGNGKGDFSRSRQLLPSQGFESTSVVIPLDFDNDGDSDLFVGGRSVPSFYGIPADSYILINDGKGNFQELDNNSEVLKRLGLVTDATFTDLNQDGKNELIVVGRWMPVKIFEISNGSIADVSNDWGTNFTDGWYNTVEVIDYNNDDKMDLLLGNHGLNSRFHASKDEPIELWIGDYDDNGTLDQIISMYSDGRKYPFVQLKELGEKLPSIAQKYSSFNEYKFDDLDTAIPIDIRKKGQVMKTYNLASGLLVNTDGKLIFEELPMQVQISPIYTFQIEDYNGDENVDVIVGGNFAESKPEVGSYLASFATLLLGSPEGGFKYLSNIESGLKIPGPIRDSEQVKMGEKSIIIFTRNNDEIFSIQY